MNRYTIYCTEEQTKKALELGAPIELESEYYHPTEHDFKLDNPIPCKSFANGYHYAKCPTTEQMIGWLEEQENIAEICIKRYGNWRYEIYIEPYHHQEEGGFLSRKEATLAAIDKALEYLKEQKESRNSNKKRR